MWCLRLPALPEVKRCCSKLLAARANITERCTARRPWSQFCDAANGRSFADLGASRRGWDWPGTYDEYHGFNSRPPKFFSNDLTKFLELKVCLGTFGASLCQTLEGPFCFFFRPNRFPIFTDFRISPSPTRSYPQKNLKTLDVE